ncbi:MAG: hypothetical protein HEQ39_17455 [Rhizobacter sp.]
MLKLAGWIFSALLSTVVHANPNWEFTRDKLSKNEPELMNWKVSIARIEVVSDSTQGTNGALPAVTFRVTEILREGHLIPRDLSGLFKAFWLVDPAGGPNWEHHTRTETLDAWEDVPVISPPVGTRALVFAYFSGEMMHLRSQDFFPDTDENRQIALVNASEEPLLSRFSHINLLCIVVFPLIGLVLVARHPLSAVTLALTVWPIYWLYESQIPFGTMFRFDLIPAMGGLTVSGLVLLLAIWRNRAAVLVKLFGAH